MPHLSKTIDEIPDVADPPASEELARLYREAFERFGPMALWSSRPVAVPTAGAAMAITRSLRVEGNLDARRLAERIEALCRAAH